MTINYLALGDSYTIGEQLQPEQNFPFQTKYFLKELYNIEVKDPQIIAKTGWTTDELLTAIKNDLPQNKFSFVTLLIGVNNQYRSYSPIVYEKEFGELLSMAIGFANGDAKRVFVLSIPDWGQTPFANGRDKDKIKKEINLYNKINKSISDKMKVHYLDVTISSRLHGMDFSYLTPDLLHYSGEEYKLWAKELSTLIKDQLCFKSV